MSRYLRYNFWFLALVSQLVSLTIVSAQELKRVRFGYPVPRFSPRAYLDGQG